MITSVPITYTIFLGQIIINGMPKPVGNIKQCQGNVESDFDVHRVDDNTMLLPVWNKFKGYSITLL